MYATRHTRILDPLTTILLLLLNLNSIVILLAQSFAPPCLPRIQVQLLVPESAQQLDRSLYALIYPTASKPFANPNVCDIHPTLEPQPAKWHHSEQQSLPKHQDCAVKNGQAGSPAGPGSTAAAAGGAAAAAGGGGGGSVGGGIHHFVVPAGLSGWTSGVHRLIRRTSSLAMGDLEAGLGAPQGEVQRAGLTSAGGGGVRDVEAVVGGVASGKMVKSKKKRGWGQQQQQRASLPKLEGSLFWGVYRAAVQVRMHSFAIKKLLAVEKLVLVICV